MRIWTSVDHYDMYEGTLIAGESFVFVLRCTEQSIFIEIRNLVVGALTYENDFITANELWIVF